MIQKVICTALAPFEAIWDVFEWLGEGKDCPSLWVARSLLQFVWIASCALVVALFAGLFFGW